MDVHHPLSVLSPHGKRYLSCFHCDAAAAALLVTDLILSWCIQCSAECLEEVQPGCRDCAQCISRRGCLHDGRRCVVWLASSSMWL